MNIFFKNPHVNHSRSSSASSLLTSSNGSSSQGYASATASPTISTAKCTSNSNESEAIIAKVQIAGKDDLLYKKVRVSRNRNLIYSVIPLRLSKFLLKVRLRFPFPPIKKLKYREQAKNRSYFLVNSAE
jgi:hypothetical protein